METHLELVLDNAALVTRVTWDGPMEVWKKTWVNIDEFCKEWECIAVIDVGTSDRSNQRERLDNNENNNGVERHVGMDENSG